MPAWYSCGPPITEHHGFDVAGEGRGGGLEHFMVREIATLAADRADQRSGAIQGIDDDEGMRACSARERVAAADTIRGAAGPLGKLLAERLMIAD